MTSARKKAAETLAMADVVVEVLDARLPAASSNPMIHELRAFRQRPCLKLLNKADLADPEATKAWLRYFSEQPGVSAVAISCKKAGDVARIPALAQKLAPHRNDAVKPLRLMIMGIPNVGKSTLLNALVKKKVAAVGDQPAVTKSQQRIDISSRLTLYDTPGMLWPKIADPVDGLTKVTIRIPEEIYSTKLYDQECLIYLMAKRCGKKAETTDGNSSFPKDP